MNVPSICPGCGAAQREGLTCEDAFHQMLFWEAEDPANGEVHHLMVVCYHLQHPHLYSPEGLNWGIQLLGAFLRGASPAAIRAQMRAEVDSGSRRYKITATAANYGVYAHPIQWSMSAIKVVEAGVENYPKSVRTWAQLVYQDLKISGNVSD